MPYIHRHFNSISKSYYSHTRGTNASSLPAEYVILKKWKKNPQLWGLLEKLPLKCQQKYISALQKTLVLKLIPKWFDTWKLMVLKCKIKLPLSIVSVTAKKSILKYAVTHILENTTHPHLKSDRKFTALVRWSQSCLSSERISLILFNVSSSSRLE